MSFIICFDIATSVLTTVIVVVYNPFDVASNQIPAPASQARCLWHKTNTYNAGVANTYCDWIQEGRGGSLERKAV